MILLFPHSLDESAEFFLVLRPPCMGRTWTFCGDELLARHQVGMTDVGLRLTMITLQENPDGSKTKSANGSNSEKPFKRNVQTDETS